MSYKEKELSDFFPPSEEIAYGSGQATHPSILISKSIILLARVILYGINEYIKLKK